MSMKGEVVFNGKRNVWAVKLRWKGQRYYFSSYMGVPCTVKPWAEQLLAEIRGEINALTDSVHTHVWNMLKVGYVEEDIRDSIRAGIEAVLTGKEPT